MRADDLAAHVLRALRFRDPDIDWDAVDDCCFGCAGQEGFALRSRRRAKAAQEAGSFAREIAPITVPGRKGEVVVSQDEHPSPDTTRDALARLKTPFREAGTVTAGVEPGIMGVGSAPATEKLLARTGLSLGAIDLIA